MSDIIKNKLKINPTVSYRNEGDTVLLSNMLPMNRTAGDVLNLYRSNIANYEDILIAMHKRYPDVDIKLLDKDVKALITQLLNHKILVKYDMTEKELGQCNVGLVPNFTQILKKCYNNALSAPTRVSCKVTCKCNANCLHCYANTDEPGEELSLDEWESFFDRLGDLGIFSVTFTGGDPLCRTDVVEMVSYCRKKNISVTIVTNGLALSREKALLLKDAGINAIFQSLDGSKPEIHDGFRQVPGLFKKVVANIQMLQELNIRTAILTTLSKFNLEDIEDLIDLVHSKSVEIHSLMRFIDAGLGYENKHLMPTPEDLLRLIPRVYKKLKEKGKYKLLFPDIPAKYYEKTLGLEVYDEIKRGGLIGPCSAGISTIAIGATGGIKVCDISINKYLGNIRNDDLQKVWLESPILNKIRNTDKNSESPCSNCKKLKDICWSGCRAHDYQLENYKNCFKSDIVCKECYNLFVKGSDESAKMCEEA